MPKSIFTGGQSPVPPAATPSPAPSAVGLLSPGAGGYVRLPASLRVRRPLGGLRLRAGGQRGASGGRWAQNAADEAGKRDQHRRGSVLRRRERGAAQPDLQHRAVGHGGLGAALPQPPRRGAERPRGVPRERPGGCPGGLRLNPAQPRLPGPGPAVSSGPGLPELLAGKRGHRGGGHGAKARSRHGWA